MNDLRRYIEIINEGDSTKRIDELGGFIDKSLSKLKSIPGLKDVGIKAGARVDQKDLYNQFYELWIKHTVHTGAKKRDSAALKDWLINDLEQPEEIVNRYPGLDKPKANVKTALMAVAKQLARELNSMNKKTKADGGIKGKSKAVDNKMMKAFQEVFNGDGRKALKEASRVSPEKLANNPLALIGYLVVKGNQ